MSAYCIFIINVQSAIIGTTILFVIDFTPLSSANTVKILSL